MTSAHAGSQLLSYCYMREIEQLERAIHGMDVHNVSVYNCENPYSHT